MSHPTEKNTRRNPPQLGVLDLDALAIERVVVSLHYSGD